MSYLVHEEFDVNENHVAIIQDKMAENPRISFDRITTMPYMKRSKYTLGDKAVDPEEIRAITKRRDVIWLPVYAYIHSGITINTTGFSCPWDSGQCGIIYVERDAVRKEWGKKRISPKLHQKIIDIMNSEIKEFDQYLQGDVWGYVITDSEGEQVDSCWGFYGVDSCIKEAKLTAECKEKIPA